MKKHAIIPIFIPHRGCPNDCVFCNQKKITARQDDVTPDAARGVIETWLSTLEPNRIENGGSMETVEVAFFGGSFTGLPIEEQSAFLAVAHEYKINGRIDKIHLSTRPDYINEEILDNLKAYSVDVIELGVQSLCPAVLKAAGRGHDADCVYKASRLIQDYGFTLGIQLMVGLPGSDLEAEIYSAKETVSIKPELARLYPTVILPETALFDMYKDGIYKPMTEEDAVVRTAAMYKILDEAGIQIIRVGLKSSDIINAEEDGAAADTFHPAFRQLVEGLLARDQIEEQLTQLKLLKQPTSRNLTGQCIFVSTEKSRNTLFGHKSANRKYFAQKYPVLKIKYVTDVQAGLTLRDGQYCVVMTD